MLWVLQSGLCCAISLVPPALTLWHSQSWKERTWQQWGWQDLRMRSPFHQALNSCC